MQRAYSSLMGTAPAPPWSPAAPVTVACSEWPEPAHADIEPQAVTLNQAVLDCEATGTLHNVYKNKAAVVRFLAFPPTLPASADQSLHAKAAC